MKYEELPVVSHNKQVLGLSLVQNRLSCFVVMFLVSFWVGKKVPVTIGLVNVAFRFKRSYFLS